jgi:hypothetical protein
MNRDIRWKIMIVALAASLTGFAQAAKKPAGKSRTAAKSSTKAKAAAKPTAAAQPDAGDAATAGDDAGAQPAAQPAAPKSSADSAQQGGQSPKANPDAAKANAQSGDEAAKGGKALDMTIKGEARDKITIERVAPVPDVAIKDVIPFSRLGQTDWILSEELNYLDEEKQVALMDVRSPKTYKPSMIEFPKPPFFVQAYPPPPQPVVVDRSPGAAPPRGENETWTFIVVDQNNQLLKKIEGTTVPPEPIQWDGMNGNDFMLRTDEIYSSMLVIQETPDVARTIVGEPIWLPALRYLKGNSIVFEFSNKRVYNENAPGFAPALQVLVDQVMNELRKYEGSPFEVVIYDRDLDQAQRRAELWRTTLEASLLKPDDSFKVRTATPGDRGAVTQVNLEITK